VSVSFGNYPLFCLLPNWRSA